MLQLRQLTLTHWIIAVNTAAFLLSAMLSGSLWSISIQTLVDLGANYGPYTTDGAWWRLLSSTVLHAGAIHYVFNNAVLYQIGGIVEQLVAKSAFLLIYILCGIGASATSLYFNYGVVSIGASGAIFGLFGFFAAMLTTDMLRPAVRKQFVKSIGVFVLINVAIGMVGPIDNAAHLGGLVTGFLIGLLCLPLVRKRLYRAMATHAEAATDNQEPIAND